MGLSNRGSYRTRPIFIVKRRDSPSSDRPLANQTAGTPSNWHCFLIYSGAGNPFLSHCQSVCPCHSILPFSLGAIRNSQSSKGSIRQNGVRHLSPLTRWRLGRHSGQGATRGGGGVDNLSDFYPEIPLTAGDLSRHESVIECHFVATRRPDQPPSRTRDQESLTVWRSERTSRHTRGDARESDGTKKRKEETESRNPREKNGVL